MWFWSQRFSGLKLRGDHPGSVGTFEELSSPLTGDFQQSLAMDHKTWAFCSGQALKSTSGAFLGFDLQGGLALSEKECVARDHCLSGTSF